MSNKIRGLIREPHDLSDVISALSNKNLYINEAGPRNESKLISELASFLKSKYRKNYYKGSNTPKGIAETKSRAILGIDEIPKNSKIDCFYEPKNLAGKRPIERFSEAIDAMNKGRISQIKLNFPWHPEIFWDEDLPTTFPFQHTSAILYSGQPKHIFFSAEGKKFMFEKYDKPRNPRSILVQGGLRGGDKYKNTGNDEAVYMGSLSVAEGYPLPNDDDGIKEGIYQNSPMLEVHVPTKHLKIHRGGDNPDSVEDMERIYSTPEEFLKECRDSDSLPDFMLSQETHDLPIENIVGVWDREYSSPTPHFLPLKQYYLFLKKKYPDRLPNPEEIVLNVKNADTPEYDQEIRKITKFEKLLEEIPKITPTAHHIKSINGVAINSDSDVQDLVSDLQRTVDYLQHYDEDLKELRKVVQEEFVNHNISWKQLDFTQFAGRAAKGEYIMKEQEVRGKIRRTANNHIEENMSKKELKKAEKELIKDLGQFPLIDIDEKQLVETGIFLVDFQKSKIGRDQLEKELLQAF